MHTGRRTPVDITLLYLLCASGEHPETRNREQDETSRREKEENCRRLCEFQLHGARARGVSWKNVNVIRLMAAEAGGLRSSGEQR